MASLRDYCNDLLQTALPGVRQQRRSVLPDRAEERGSLQSAVSGLVGRLGPDQLGSLVVLLAQRTAGLEVEKAMLHTERALVEQVSMERKQTRTYTNPCARNFFVCQRCECWNWVYDATPTLPANAAIQHSTETSSGDRKGADVITSEETAPIDEEVLEWHALAAPVQTLEAPAGNHSLGMHVAGRTSVVLAEPGQRKADLTLELQTLCGLGNEQHMHERKYEVEEPPLRFDATSEHPSLPVVDPRSVGCAVALDDLVVDDEVQWFLGPVQQAMLSRASLRGAASGFSGRDCPFLQAFFGEVWETWLERGRVADLDLSGSSLSGEGDCSWMGCVFCSPM